MVNFTFYCSSIKGIYDNKQDLYIVALHSTVVLLKVYNIFFLIYSGVTLHSTVVLLKG